MDTAVFSMAQAQQELDRCVMDMLLKEPFYGHLLGGIVRRAGTDCSTAAVALTPAGPQLIVNPAFFLGELSATERVAVVKHEALHLVFRHLYRPRQDGWHAALFNIAADLVVNQHVAPWPLPEVAVTLKLFPDLSLRPNQTLDWYYDKLAALHAAMQQGLPHAWPRSEEALRRMLPAEGRGEHDWWACEGGHGFEGTESGVLSEALRKALETELERHVLRARSRTSAPLWGKLPAGVRTQVDQVQQGRQPQLDWRRTLRLFAASGTRTKVVPTRRRMSKRFDDFPGLRIKREQRLAVVVDTSGSISRNDLAAFFSEIHGVWRTGAEVVVLECDAAVQRSQLYRGQPIAEVKGGGGTSFDPAFEWLRQPRNGRFDACIYLTDGYGPQPTIRPKCPLLWLITATTALPVRMPWGRVVRLRG